MHAQPSGLRVFVMGCSRGGTTLTQRLVVERLGLYTLPETRFFANLIGNLDQRMFPTTRRRRSALRALSSDLRERLGLSTGMEHRNISLSALRQRRKWSPIRPICDAFVAALDQEAAAQGFSGWLEKTPFHIHYAPRIAAMVPEAWMIHILRDPQETIASLRDVATRYPASWGITYDRVERAVDNWNASVADSAAMVGKARQIFVPYAALSMAPEAVLDRIAGQMGVTQSFNGSIKGSIGQLAGNDEHWKAGALDSPVRPALSKWDTALSPDERNRAQALIRPVPEALLKEMAAFTALLPTTGKTA